MKKRLISILLILCMMLNILPATALAAAPADANYHYSDVTWLGTTAEYQKTLKVLFDSGLRKAAAGDKYGLADMSGNWVSEPIYEKIEAHYWHWNSDGSKTFYPRQGEYERTETIFADGYVQAIRGGKMGLLDTTDREVIPCNYDTVGLPFDGISRVSKTLNGKT